MPSDTSAVADLNLIGVGLNPPRHITEEARVHLAGCDIVFHLTAHHAFLKSCVSGEVRDLGDHYRAKRSADAYREQAEMMLAELRQGCRIGFATYGHPMVLVDTCQMLLQAAREEGFSHAVVSGISSVDVMLERLQLDIGLAGLLAIETNKMVMNRVRPDPTVSTILLQIGAYGSLDLTLDRRNHPRRFDGLCDYLMQTYHANHPAILMTCGFVEGMEDIVHCTTIGALGEAADLIHTGMSMYIPPLQPDIDQDVLRQMADGSGAFDQD